MPVTISQLIEANPEFNLMNDIPEGAVILNFDRLSEVNSVEDLRDADCFREGWETSESLGSEKEWSRAFGDNQYDHTAFVLPSGEYGIYASAADIEAAREDQELAEIEWKEELEKGLEE